MCQRIQKHASVLRSLFAALHAPPRRKGSVLTPVSQAAHGVCTAGTVRQQHLKLSRPS